MFLKLILIVFIGNFLNNFCNLLYQLLIAHKLTLSEFAGFNSLLSIFTMVSAPLGTIQLVVAKYVSEFNARRQAEKISSLIYGILKKSLLFAFLTLFLFAVFSGAIVRSLKIESPLSGYILAIALALAWIFPVFSGSVQGLELFGWICFSQILSGVAKLILAFIFLALGYKIAGALGALAFAVIIGLFILNLALDKRIDLRTRQDGFYGKEIFLYLLPVAAANFCYIALVSMDMVLVKYYFSQQESGFYSLAQMVGKIFLFLPAAISIVIFPRTSGLKAKNLETGSTLRKSLVLGLLLCVIAAIVYNLFPQICLSILTGKPYPQAQFLGRLFSLSMSFFALLYILISYFLAIKDLRFIKYLGIFTFLEALAIILFHQALWQVQATLCMNAVLLFSLFVFLAGKPRLADERH